MASPDINKGLLVSGRLAYGCTNLALAWPHGGTGLGLVGSIDWRPPAGQIRLPAEEDGGTRAILYTGGDAVIGASVEGWDDSAAGGVLSALFPNTATVNTRTVLYWPGANPAAPTVPVGGMFPTVAPLVFTPINQTEHPALIVYKAIVLLEASAQLRLGSYRYLSVPILAIGTPDDQGRVAAMGRIADLSL
jgi:hypothetical protein